MGRYTNPYYVSVQHHTHPPLEQHGSNERSEANNAKRSDVKLRSSALRRVRSCRTSGGASGGFAGVASCGGRSGSTAGSRSSGGTTSRGGGVAAASRSSTASSRFYNSGILTISGTTWQNGEGTGLTSNTVDILEIGDEISVGLKIDFPNERRSRKVFEVFDELTSGDIAVGEEENEGTGTPNPAERGWLTFNEVGGSIKSDLCQNRLSSDEKSSGSSEELHD